VKRGGVILNGGEEVGLVKMMAVVRCEDGENKDVVMRTSRMGRLCGRAGGRGGEGRSFRFGRF
jgi:hypothetical protein